jgi:lysozyme family protein
MTLDSIIEQILGKEGGYVDHPDDRGGPTNWGITQRVARQHGYAGPMRELSRDQAISIYKASYWFKPSFDQIAHVSNAIALELMDTGVNMGLAVPVMALQRWLNAFNGRDPELYVDGRVGPKTIAALRKFIERRGTDGEQVLLKALNCSQGHRYLEITEGRRANEAFIFGWMKNRVNL